jgi:hypothetical protein
VPRAGASPALGAPRFPRLTLPIAGLVAGVAVFGGQAAGDRLAQIATSDSELRIYAGILETADRIP